MISVVRCLVESFSHVSVSATMCGQLWKNFRRDVRLSMFFFFERDLMLRWRMFRDGMVAVDIMCVFWLNYIFNAIIEKELKFVCTLLVFMMSIVMSLVSVILVLMISS